MTVVLHLVSLVFAVLLTVAMNQANTDFVSAVRLISLIAVVASTLSQAVIYINTKL